MGARNMLLQSKCISLFSGAMGLDLGLKRVGFNFKLFIEIDKHCNTTITTNLKRLGVSDYHILQDINQYSAIDILRLTSSEEGEVMLIAGGPPCQAFSTAGKRESLNDPRGNLVNKYFEFIEGVKPRFFVFENVRGILSAAIKHRPLSMRCAKYPPLSEEEQLGSLVNRVILPKFKDLGYEVLHGLIDTADYGVPQNRERVIFLGSRDREFRVNGFHHLMDVLKPTHSKLGDNNKEKWVTLRSAFEGLQEDMQEYSVYSQKRATIFKLVPEGKNWRYIRSTYGDDLTKEIMGGAYLSGGGKVGFWRRLSLDKPSPTLTTSPLQKSTGLCHPLYNRPLSVQEYARIQQFPDDWFFSGPLSAKYKQIGNAVPVGLGNAIGLGLINVIEKSFFRGASDEIQ